MRAQLNKKGDAFDAWGNFQQCTLTVGQTQLRVKHGEVIQGRATGMWQ